MMMARPTTTSAAATTMTKNAIIWPSMVPVARAKATSVRLTELSISSTHMNTPMALGGTSTPPAPRGAGARRRRGEVGQRQVDRVEHQLDAQEHDDGVGAHEHPDRADGEQDRRQHQVVRERHRGPSRLPRE